MRKLYIGLFLAVCLLTVEAQTSTFTLDQCIDYALKNSVNIQNSVLDEESANARVKEITGLGLPQISGSVSLTHNQQLNRFFGRNIVSSTNPDAFGFFIDVPGADDGDIVAGQNFFQLKSSGTAGLTINQLLFNGSYFVGLQAAKALRELSIKNTTTSKVAVVEGVAKAYYLAVINKERILQFNSNIDRLDTLLHNTIELNKNGLAEEIDVDRLRVNLNNLKSEKENFVNLQTLSIDILKFQMNYPKDSPLEVSESIESLDPIVDPTRYQKEFDYNLIPSYQVLNANKDLQTLNIKNYRAQALPTVSLFANLGYSTQSPDIGGLFKTTSNVTDDGIIGPDKWYGFSLYGLSINVPLFSGFQLKHKTHQEKISLAKIENNLKQLKYGIDIEIKTAMTNYENALKKMESQQQNMELSSKVARVAKIKYEQGVGSNLEVIESVNSLKESQVNYYNAMYDAIVTKVDLDKAYGKLLPQTQSN